MSTMTTDEPVAAIVVAAGSGVRLGGGTPKALRLVRGRPLVARSVDALAAGGATHIVVVIAAGLADAFAGALADSMVPVTLVPGGAERQDSVANGLAAIDRDPGVARARFVLVHDAARALVPPAVVGRVLDALKAGASAVVPVVPVVDSVRALTPEGSVVVDRARLRAVQTPQGFDRTVLARAHRFVAENGLRVTDDAAAVESLGLPIVLVEGAREAMKITEPLDLVIAEALAGK